MPSTDTAMPMCAACMPQNEMGVARQFTVSPTCRQICTADDSTIQNTSVKPIDTHSDQAPINNGRLQPSSTDTMAIGRNFFSRSAAVSPFQRDQEPSTMNTSTGVMMGANTALK